MNKLLKLFQQVPGWLVMLLIFGFLYLTGLHTEVIGQVQRIVLATGIIKPDVKGETPYTYPNNNALTPATLPVADYNFSLRTFSGEEVSMVSMKGKVVFLNFWATWCPPCIAEMPNIQSLYDKVKSDDIAFVMVSLDQDPAKAEKFVQKKGFTFPVYTPNGPLPTVYEGQVIPSTFVISPDGRIVARHNGMADYDNQEFRKFLQNMAKGRIGVTAPETNTSQKQENGFQQLAKITEGFAESRNANAMVIR